MVLSESQEKALEYLKDGKNVFLSGAAGTGKSFLLNIYYNIAVNKYGSKCVGKTSTTGVSALLINGRTIHSWAGVFLGDKDVKTLLKRMPIQSQWNWKKAKVLIIDEISMLPSELISKLDQIAKTLRKNDKPFGGIQIIFTGDFLQLPAIQSKEFCFESQVWNDTIDYSIELQTNMRQTNDAQFQKILNEVRYGDCSQESFEILQSRVGAELVNEHDIEPTKLYSKNYDVNQLNNKKYKELVDKGKEEHEYKAEYIVNFNNTTKSETDLIKLYSKNSKLPDTFKLVKGAQIMIKENTLFNSYPNSLEVRVVNGTRGVVTGFTEFTELPIVKLLSGVEIIVSPTERDYEIEDEYKVLRNRIPIVLAWACSIHSSQGASLDCVSADLGNSVFEYGQSYVVLSRVRTLEGLSLINFNKNRIKANKKAIEFYQNL